MRLFIVLDTDRDVTAGEIHAFALTVPKGATLVTVRDQSTGRDLLLEACAEHRAHTTTGASSSPSFKGVIGGRDDAQRD